MNDSATSAHAASVALPAETNRLSPNAVIAVNRVGHVFRTKGRRVQALLETDLQIREREFLTIRPVAESRR